MISELMQPIISEHDVFIDQNIGALVQGKVEILDPVSNNFLTLYTYSDDEFVVATNPVILNIEGRPEQTYFCDRMCYVRVYSYQGLDEHNQPIYSFVRDYYAGHNAQSDVSENVTTLDALKEVNPEYNTQISVVGYHNAHDCEERTYVWDPNSTLEPDNGYVVASNVTSTGRWILQFDGPYIPSSYYGVYPGHESNVAALCTFVEEIQGKRTAMGIYFIPGHYTSQQWFNTTKKVLISSSTQFELGVDAPWIDVKGKPTTWIGNLSVSDPTCPIHSCWYKSARSFWSSPSKIKYCDGRNWTDDTIVSNITNSFVTFYTNGSIALTTNTGDYKLIFTQCDLVGDSGFLYRDSKTEFRSMAFTDKFFVNSTLIAANVSFNTLMPCTFDMDDFDKPENMAATAYKGGVTEIDMKNRPCGQTTQINLSEYTVIRNLQGNQVLAGKSGVGVTFYDSEISYLDFNGSNLSLYATSVRLSAFPNIASIKAYNGSIVSGGWYLNKGSVTCQDSTWFMQINEATDNVTLSPQLTFVDSTISATINTKNLVCTDCRINNSNINIYPFKEDGKYKLRLVLEGCEINNVNPIAFTLNTNDHVCKDCWWDGVRIVNNTFRGNSKGITCPYWAYRSGQTRFISNGTPSEDGVNYDELNNNFFVVGNNGSCPGGGDYKLKFASSKNYHFNTNLDPWCSKSYNINVAGYAIRLWLPYEPIYSLASTERFAKNDTSSVLHIMRCDPDGDSPNVYHYNNRPMYSWRDYFVSNASFCLNNVDSTYDGTRDMNELDDWFAARFIDSQQSLANLMFYVN